MNSNQIIFRYELLPTTYGPQKFAKILDLKVIYFDYLRSKSIKSNCVIIGTNNYKKKFFIPGIHSKVFF